MVVLVAGNGADTREVLTERLRGEGFDATAVASGPHALEALHSVRPDVILLDLTGTDMNSWEFRSEQRKRPDVARIPVIVITGLPLGMAPPAMDAAALVSKQLGTDELTATILMLLRSYRSRSLGKALRRCF